MAKYDYFKIIRGMIKDPKVRFFYLSKMGFYDRMPDVKYLAKKYKVYTGLTLDLEHPVRYNEKLQWLKLHYHKPVHSIMVDKYLVRQYIADTIGEQYLIPLLGVWDHFDDIDFDQLPDQFVLKCTHDSGGIVICTDKSSLDRNKAKARIEQCLNRKYYLAGRERVYESVKPRIIAEKYMTDGKTNDQKEELSDYKIHCFSGEPKLVQIMTNRFSSTGIINEHYTLDWERLNLVRGDSKLGDVLVPRPAKLDELLELAKILSKDEPYIRTDFYIVEDHVYFGELTFYPSSGFKPFHPDDWDFVLGDWIKLPE